MLNRNLIDVDTKKSNFLLCVTKTTDFKGKSKEGRRLA
jgi:hypothetical protein